MVVPDFKLDLIPEVTLFEKSFGDADATGISDTNEVGFHVSARSLLQGTYSVITGRLPPMSTERLTKEDGETLRMDATVRAENSQPGLTTDSTISTRLVGLPPPPLLVRFIAGFYNSTLCVA